MFLLKNVFHPVIFRLEVLTNPFQDRMNVKMKQESAEEFALKALMWLVGNDELLPVFMGATGIGEDDLRERAGEPEFLASILDFLMMNDDWVIEFCDTQATPYDMPMRARQALPGGTDVSWT